jgi:hypothetical protein
MKRLIGGLLLIAGLLVVLVGCPSGTEMTVQQRVEAFIEDINASPPDYSLVKAHFSPDTPSYGSLQLQSFWDATYFAVVDQPFTLGTMSLDDQADGGYTGGVTYDGEISSPTAGTYTATFILVPDADALLVENWLIRQIDISDGSLPIYSYR